MRFTTLGRTGLKVSAIGLGCGGPSRLGQAQGQSNQESKRVIFRALELGINFFDSAETYGTEPLLGEALAEARAGDNVIVSTKKGVWDWARKQLCTPSEMRDGLHASLRRLGRERIDVYHLHGLELEHVDYALSEVLPVLRSAQRDGKIGHLAVSEAFMVDTRHQMLQRVLQDDVFEVMMVGFNLLNSSARRSVFPVTQELGVGTLIMFAVRRALTNPARLNELIETLIVNGELSLEGLDRDHPLGFLGDVRDAGYRYCAHEPGADLVLTGTGSVEHLEANVASLLAGPLEAAQRRQIERLFGALDTVSGH